MSIEKTDTSSREWGDILADVGVGALRGYAQNGLRGAIAGGIIGGIEGGKQAENEALERENARLRNQALKQQIEFDKNREARAAAADHRAGQAHARQMQQAKVNYENSQMKLYLTQAAVYGNEFDAGMKKVIDKQGLDFESQNMFFNSSAYKEARDMWVAFKMYDNNPDSAVALLKNVGWNVETDKDGKTWLYQTTADGKQKRLEFNEATISALRDSVNEKFMDFYGTSVAVGTDASTLNQAALKNIFNSPEVKSVYGNNLLDAGREYKAFLKNNKFTSEEIAGHVMNRTLQSAIIDGKLSQEEMKILIPQFQLALKKFGGEIIPSADGSIEKTFIKLKDGREISLKTLAQDLNERDIVWHRWNDTMRAKAVAKETAMLEKANREMLLQNRILNNQEKKNRNAGGVGSSDAAGETSPVEWDSQEAKYYYDLGGKIIKEYNIHFPNGATPEQITTIGVAFNAAENAKKSTGLNYYAEEAFGKIWKRSGKIFSSRNAQGGVFPFMTRKARKEDVAYLEKAIAQEKNPEKKQFLVDLKTKIESSLKETKVSPEKQLWRDIKTNEIENYMRNPTPTPIPGSDGYFIEHQKSPQQKAREYASGAGIA